jgi:hypothetical protein
MGAASSATLYQSLRENTAGRPFILCILQSGKAHGVLFEASGALEIVTRPSNLISVRTTAGAAATLKVHTFVGDSPAEVFDALTQYTGQRGNLLCLFGRICVLNANTIARILKILNANAFFLCL